MVNRTDEKCVYCIAIAVSEVFRIICFPSDTGLDSSDSFTFHGSDHSVCKLNQFF